ncbi:MAG TPA: MaoC family dehydratase [Jatrophihabitantaceae bacterium]|jgi:acyl dehydratase|nr:MaoC family dehydratase [Jatrophihabitantaceae bacterium]
MSGMTGIEIGTELPAQEFPISRFDLVRYAGASGDFNPIHWNERFAKSVGLPDVIAHGMFTMATAVRVVTDWIGDPAAVVEYSVRFTRPVVVSDPEGARLQVSGQVRAIRDDGLIEVDLTATSDGQTVLAKARAVVRPPAGRGTGAVGAAG